MRIALIAETPAMPTGFGMQTQLLCEGFAARKNEVFLLAASVPMRSVKMEGVSEYRYANIYDIDMTDRELYRIAPDVVFVFGCTAFVAHFLQLRSSPPNCPVFFWLPYEGSRLPDNIREMFRGTPPNTVVHLSKFAQKMWAAVLHSDLVIPHAVDTELWKFVEHPEEERGQLRRQFARRFRFPMFDDSFIVVNVDRNIWHKRWDATFDYVRRLQEAMPGREVQLIAHTKMVQDTEGGHPPGYNLPYLERVYGLKNQVCYTGFDWGDSLTRSDVIDLMRCADVRITTSQGEGFGVPTIEAASAGILQVVNNSTTMPELLGSDSPSLVDAAMIEDRMGSLWSVPNVGGMVDRTLQLLADPVAATFLREKNREWVVQNFAVDDVVEKFLTLFSKAVELNPPEQLYYGNRWGYQKQWDMPAVWGDLARCLSKLRDRPNVLELGAFFGKFVETCTEFGISAVGIEPDRTPYENSSARVRHLLTCQEWKAAWPPADVVVATDIQDAVHASGGNSLLQNVFGRMADYLLVAVRFRPDFVWHRSLVNPEQCRMILKTKLVRRKDLEEKARSEWKLEKFEHELYAAPETA